MPRRLPFAVQHDGAPPASLLAPVRILIIDPAVLPRTALACLLGRQPGLEIYGQAGSPPQALTLCDVTPEPPDLVLLNVDTLGSATVDTVGLLRRELSSSGVVVLASQLDDAHLLGVLRSGAQGVLLTSTEPDDLFIALRAAAAGEVPVSPPLVTRLALGLRRTHTLPVDAVPDDATATLSQREREVLQLVAAGMTNRQIGRSLCITEGTVKNHVHNALRKLDMDNRLQAAALVMHSKTP